MTTKQELFAKYIRAAVQREDWRASWFEERQWCEDASWEGRKRAKDIQKSLQHTFNNLHRDLPSLDRACNFVARQLGLLEER